MNDSAGILIIGQGLAGTCLALRLAMEGKKFTIISSPKHASASRKAAGLMNPVTGRRMALTWNFENIWPLAMDFYPAAISFLGEDGKGIFTSRSIRKALHSHEEMNFLEAKSAWAGFRELVRIEAKKDIKTEVFANLSGWAISDAGARLQVPEFLEAARIFFEMKGHFREEEFLPEDLEKSEPAGTWHWKGKKFDGVVSCLGLGCPWISPELWAVKGQLFTLQGLPEWGPDVLKTEHFLIPLANGRVLAGSTYEREFEHAEPDKQGFDLITGEILPAYQHKIKVTESIAGVRPTTNDRRPVIRQLEEGLFAINGLGSKGVSLAPYAAAALMKMLFPGE